MLIFKEFVNIWANVCFGIMMDGEERAQVIDVFECEEDMFEILGVPSQELYRAKHPPRVTRPKDIPYEEFDKLVAGQKTEENTAMTKLPREWCHEILRTVSELYQDGVIVPSTEPGPYASFCGRASPDAPLKMYIDYRTLAKYAQVGKIGRVPPTSPTYLKDELTKAFKKGNTHFSYLRFASAHSHWYLHFDNEPDQKDTVDCGAFTFVDPYSRSWKWNRRPKDLPYATDDQHEHLQGLLERAKLENFATAQVDRLVVWGRSRKECYERSMFVSMALFKPAMGVLCKWSESFVCKPRKLAEEMDMGWWTFP